MPSPRFSVVIPTREGAPTLRFTLRTCLEQDHGDYEVVVCDNFGSPATRELVEELADPRIRYLRSDRPLSMSSNWELAVAQARGEYVTVLGDDDGLLPHALRTLDSLLRRHPTPALRWSAAFYTWPNVAVREAANCLRIPAANALRTLEARTVMGQVIRFRRCYTALPMLLNSVVRRDVLEALRRRVGQLFPAAYPDVCSGFLIGAWVGEYLAADVPFSIAGLSDKSVGVGHHFIPSQNSRGQDFLALNAAEKRTRHPHVPDIHVFPAVPVADCFLVAKAALFPEDDALRIDRRVLASQCVGMLSTETDSQWRDCMGKIRASLADEPELAAWFDTVLADHPPNSASRTALRSPDMGFDAESLQLDAAEFGVRDVHAAAQLCDRILGCRDPQGGTYFGRRTAAHVEAQLVEMLGVAAPQQQLLELAAQRLGRNAELEKIAASQQLELERLRRLTRGPRAVYRALKAVARRLTRRSA